MTEKKLKSILTEHPYLIDSAFVRSRSEAVRIAGESSVTIEEFIERSKERSLLPAQAWDVFAQALADKRAKETKVKPSSNPVISPLKLNKPNFIRKAAAVFVVLFLLTAFFTLTEPGTTLARVAHEIIVKLFGDGVTARHGRDADSLSPIDFENIPEYIETLEQAAKAIGRPIASIDDEDAELVDIMVDQMPDNMVMLRTEYRIRGNTLFLEQIFYAQDTVWGSSDKLQIEFEVQLQNGNTMYMGHLSDGAVWGYAYSDNFNISLLSKGMDIDELSDIAAGMHFLE